MDPKNNAPRYYVYATYFVLISKVFYPATCHCSELCALVQGMLLFFRDVRSDKPDLLRLQTCDRISSVIFLRIYLGHFLLQIFPQDLRFQIFDI